MQKCISKEESWGFFVAKKRSISVEWYVIKSESQHWRVSFKPPSICYKTHSGLWLTISFSSCLRFCFATEVRWKKLKRYHVKPLAGSQKWSSHTDLGPLVLCCPVNGKRKQDARERKEHETKKGRKKYGGRKRLINIEVEVSYSLCRISLTCTVSHILNTSFCECSIFKVVS